MYQVVARVALTKINEPQSGVLFTGAASANYRVNLFGSISETKGAIAGTAGLKVETVDDFGVTNNVTLDLVSGSAADDDFAIGLIQGAAGKPITWGVITTSQFPTDCDFTMYATLEQDVVAVNSL